MHQRLIDSVRGRPDISLLAVDGQREQPSPLEGDLPAIGDVHVGGGCHHVVLTSGQPGGGERAADRPGQRGDLPLLAVHGDGDVLGHGSSGATADGQRADGCGGGNQQDLATQATAGRGCRCRVGAANGVRRSGGIDVSRVDDAVGGGHMCFAVGGRVGGVFWCTKVTRVLLKVSVANVAAVIHVTSDGVVGSRARQGFP